MNFIFGANGSGKTTIVEL
ncbi:hypothetical protein ABTO68_19660 [Acinetobacter baumannii]|nr:hypothetical protein [Acinetobacter oleivorans]